MFNKQYAETLQAWVLGEVEKVGSLRQLANRFVAIALELGEDAISVQTLSDWSKGKLKQEIKQRPLRQLAAYRQETVEVTRLWLEGVNRQPDGLQVGEFEGECGNQVGMLQLLEQISRYAQTCPLLELSQVLHDLADIMAIASSRLHQSLSDSSMCHPLRRLLLNEAQNLGFNLADSRDRGRFLSKSEGSLTRPESQQKLDILIDWGRNTFDRLEVVALGTMMRSLGAEHLTEEAILEYVKNPPREALEGCELEHLDSV